MLFPEDHLPVIFLVEYFFFFFYNFIFIFVTLYSVVVIYESLFPAYQAYHVHVCVNLDFSWPAVLNVSKRSQMMGHFSKIYYNVFADATAFIAFETGGRNVLKKN